VRNGAAKRAGSDSFRVNMNPLMVARCLGEKIDLLLRDGGPVTGRDFLANAGCQLRQGLKVTHGELGL